ncbi:MAG: hypothetical protein ABS81_08385 [Pseudonocardia sp. SCN 72-86]|nr:MAG: hypothetical protein ABS81_08385 [Pseudonocardia sp. SCN 72-86]
MPSSMIFVSLVAIWLLILVPTVARRRQEVARPSAASLSGRVLARPGRERLDTEVALMDRTDERLSTTVDAADGDADRDSAGSPAPRTSEKTELQVDDDPGRLDGWDDTDEEGWERPPARFRPGRGGFDAEAAALNARARYAARQRIVLGLLGAVVVSALLALLLSSGIWWLTGLVGATLTGYLIYLRRQVRMEEAIRARRAARAAGTRRTPAADDPALDEWAARGRAVGRRDEDDLDEDDHDLDDAGSTLGADDGWVDASARKTDSVRKTDSGRASDAVGESEDGESEAGLDDDGDPTRVKGVGEPLGILPGKRRTVGPTDEDADDESEAALPRIAPTPPPPLPAGTSLVEVDEEELELGELDSRERPGYRRAAGQ